MLAMFRSFRGLARPRVLVPALLAAWTLAACGGGNDGAQVQWIEGTPPPELIAQFNGSASDQVVETPAETEPAGAGDSEPTKVIEPDPTVAPTATTAPPEQAVTGVRLSADQLEEYRPNELGVIPVLEYHVITTDASLEEQFVRTADDFRADLEWLYEHDFYVISLKSLIEDRIAAPAGKHPVVLTFDDSTAGQFRYLIDSDGSVAIDPDSAVAIMEIFYGEHPDFGRGGFFAVLPQEYSCFSWQGQISESDQFPYCQQKLTWLIDNGYEIGNHTLNHTDLLNVDDDTFRSELVGAIDAFKAYDPRIEANILAMPYGNYPDLETKQEQRGWLRHGFVWKGEDYKIIGCLMVGDNPTESPVSTEYDPVFIARIQAFDDDANVDGRGSAFWFAVFEDDPDQLYTSDGDPDTITVPENLPPAMEGTLDEEKVKADGKELVRY